MPLPNFPHKHRLASLFHPADYPGHPAYVLGRRELRPPDALMPSGAVLIYSDALLAEVLAGYDSVSRGYPEFVGFHEVRVRGGTVAVVHGFGLGGPAAARTVEEIIAAGVRRVVSIGGAGGLHPALSVGDLVVCDGAVRDEGVSYHYLAVDDTYVRPDAELTGRLLDAVKERVETVHVGPTWTTDAIYRETREEAVHYRTEGVLTVEMEAASLAAVALYRGVAFATAFAVMDLLMHDGWHPEGFRHPDALAGLVTLFDAAAETALGDDR